jgi:hypothetical protein
LLYVISISLSFKIICFVDIFCNFVSIIRLVNKAVVAIHELPLYRKETKGAIQLKMQSKQTNIKEQIDQTINIVVDKAIYTAIHDIAKSEGLPLPMLIRDLLKEALELREDVLLVQFAEDREKTFDNSTALTHEEVWQ